jgi:hypothetical protein
VPSNLKLYYAKRLKRDDLYTKSTYIEKELKNYMNHFNGKTVLCNCEDDEKSEFFKYFQKLFEVLGLKKLIGVHYESEEGKPSYKLELYKDTNNDGQVTWKDKVIKTPIYGDDKYTAGDFRSKDCIELLKEADFVVTNPPFSLLREFVAQLIEYDKKFLIIGNINAISYKQIFPLFKENKIWLGISTNPESKEGCKGVMEFCAPKSYEIETKSCREDEEGNKYVKITNIRWFTNLKTEYRQPPLQLTDYYTKESYPKYDNYDAINVDKVADIPCDYPGVMGVPLTFMDKYCPEQFEIVGLAGKDGFGLNSFKHYDRYKEMRSNGQPTGSSGKKTNGNPVMEGKTFKGNYFVNISGRIVRSLYSRIFIKNKHPEESECREKNIKEHVLNKVFDTGIAFKVLQKAA